MRSPWLFLALIPATLVGPLTFTSPAAAQMLPPCCVREGETHPPDPHLEPGPILVPAEVRRTDERALEASAEAQVTADAPLVDALGIPLEPLDEERRGVSEPAVVPVPMFAAELQPQQEPSFDINTAPCCRPPGREPEDPPPFLVAAKVKNPDERELVEKAKAALRRQVLLATAIAIPMSERPATAEPRREPVIAARRLPQGTEIDGPPCCTARDREQGPPVTVDAPWAWLLAMKVKAEVIIAVFVILLAIGFWFRVRRRRTLSELEPLPATRPLPDELPRPDAAPVPQLEPEIVRARDRELEPA